MRDFLSDCYEILTEKLFIFMYGIIVGLLIAWAIHWVIWRNTH